MYEMENIMAESLHDGHRERLKKRFMERGLKDFEDHEILELALFYSIPRVNTNEIAHRLIKKFGSVRNVCYAPIEELVKIQGIGKESAVFLKFLADFVDVYERKPLIVGKSFHDLDKMGEYLADMLIGGRRETIAAMFFHSNGVLIAAEEVAHGDEFSACVPIKTILSRAFVLGASAVAIAHNHPNGVAIPSDSDVMVTSELKYICEKADVEFIEHFVVSGHEYFPILRRKFRHSTLLGTKGAN
jgi:DNA repair protein RadC